MCGAWLLREEHRSGLLPQSHSVGSAAANPKGKNILKERLAYKKRNYLLEKGAKQTEKGFVNPE